MPQRSQLVLANAITLDPRKANETAGITNFSNRATLLNGRVQTRDQSNGTFRFVGALDQTLTAEVGALVKTEHLIGEFNLRIPEMATDVAIDAFIDNFKVMIEAHREQMKSRTHYY